MKKIIVFGNMDLPEGSAGATRCVAFARLAKSCGYEASLLGVNYKGSPVTKGTYQGIKYELIDFDELKYTGKKAHCRKRTLKRECLTWFNKNCTKYNTECVITYNVKSELSWLINFSRTTDIPLIKDVVEWYDKNNFIGVSGIANFIEDRIGLYYWNKKCKNIIAISTYFEKFYHKKGCNTVRIPTILDTRLFDSSYDKVKNCEKIVISYAGSPVKKDYISNAVRALLLLAEEERQKIQLNIYGVSWEFFEQNGFTAIEKRLLEDSLTCFGRVSHEEVKQGLRSSDFTILLRPDVRYANAGFPTKVGESMAAGIPVIANLTSDIGQYLRDGVEGIVCDNESSEACATAFKRAIDLADEQHKCMRECARRQAQKSFDYRAYKEIFWDFLQKINEG